MSISIGLALFALYLVLGLVVAVPFAFGAVNRLDAFAREGSLGFRIAILPGLVAAWPWVLRRWTGAVPVPTEVNAHRRAAAGLPNRAMGATRSTGQSL